MSLLPDLERTFLDAAERHELREASEAASVTVTHTTPVRARPSRWRLPVFGGGALVAVTAAVVIAVVGVPGGDDKLSFVEEASAALAPRDGILYLKLSSKSRATMNGKPIDSVGQAALTQHTEQWSTEAPRRHRYVVHASAERVSSQPEKHVQPHMEFAWANRAETTYDADERSMRTITGHNVNSSASRSMALLGDAPIAIEDLRGALATGKLVERGRAVVDGHPVIRLVGRLPRQGGQDDVRLAYDVDATSFQPRRIVVRWSVTFPGPHITTMENVSTTTVERYERLPLTPENEQLLTIYPPVGTKIRVQTKEQALAEGKAKLARDNAEGRRNAERMRRERAGATPRP